MTHSTQHLFLFHIGPVQTFIAQARRTQDLYVGSRLLSQLALTAVEAAHREGAEFVFPAPINVSENEFPNTIAHRFAFLSDHEPAAFASEIEAALMNLWRTGYADKVRDWVRIQSRSDHWVDQFNRQVENWLEFYWVAVEYDVSNHSMSYGNAARALAMRKQLRHFPQIEEPGLKCTLTGTQSALAIPWDNFRRRVGEPNLRGNEKLGGMALVKRFAQFSGCELGYGVTQQSIERFPSTCEIAGNPSDNCGEDERDLPFPYFCVLAMDGDQMGKRLSALTSLAEHQEFSRTLAAFAQDYVPLIVAKHQGALVYAGGDDVLALLPLDTVLICADAIREAFHAVTGGTISAGIAIGGVKLPLDTALAEARLAEEHAKEIYGRDAVVVRDVRSNAIRESGSHWKINETILIGGLLNTLQEYFKFNWLSGKLGYDMLEIAALMTASDHLPAMRAAELERLIRQRCTDALKSESKDQLVAEILPTMVALGEHKGCGWGSLANWVILARFLAKRGNRSGAELVSDEQQGAIAQ